MIGKSSEKAFEKSSASDSPGNSLPTENDPFIPAGDFIAWLTATRSALKTNSEAEVDCRDCTGCCNSAYYITIRPEEKKTLAQIPSRLLAAAPQGSPGLKVLAHDAQGKCPMLVAGQCSIYAARPQACRNYDCRIFTAADIAPGGADKARISERVVRWRFTYANAEAQAAHQAVRAAARFIRDHAIHFPGGRVPDQPSQLAVLALKVYEVFLNSGSGPTGLGPTELGPTGLGQPRLGATEFPLDAAQLAAAVVAASRRFDEGQ